MTTATPEVHAPLIARELHLSDNQVLSTAALLDGGAIVIKLGQLGGVDAVGVEEAAVGDLGEASGEPTAAYLLGGDHPDSNLLSPSPQEPADRGEPTAFYEVWTYPHNVLRLTESEKSSQALGDQGESTVFNEMRSNPSQVY
jgi:hypothetical protein